MRKFVVIITLLYTAVAVAVLGFLSNWFREGLTLGGSVIVTTLLLSLPAILLVAVIAYWKDNEWLAVVLVAIILGSCWYGEDASRTLRRVAPVARVGGVESSVTRRRTNAQNISTG
jgi:hypothetical protein